MQQFLSFLVLFCVLNSFAQENLRYSNYCYPVTIPIALAANFGELRKNHFHMGIDIKTQGKEGFDLVAVEDGFVSRAKVSTYGYGKAVYIDHPNGKTSVYAHCSKFVGRLDSLVKEEQFRTQNFEVELYFSPKQLPVKKGEVFALSGNTGGSTAPHLHFEIRDTKTEHALNPLVYAYDLPDNRKPTVKRVKVFSLNEQGYADYSKTLEKYIKLVNDTLKIVSDTFAIPANFCSSFGGIGFAFDATDKMDGAENTNGIYGSFLVVDGDTVFGHKMNEISFDNSRYINAHRDLTVAGANYHKSFRNVSNPLEIYTNNGLGVIPIAPGQAKNIVYGAYDEKNNLSKIQFVVVADSGEMGLNFNPSYSNHWYPEDPFEMKRKEWEVVADSFTIYEPYRLMENSDAHICHIGTHLQKKVQVRMRLNNPTKAIEKYYIAVGNKALSTKYNDGWLEASTNVAGNLTIKTDEQLPVIKPVNASSIVKSSVLKFYISDAHSGLADYDLFIDDKWMLLEYEYKNNLAFYEISPELKGGEHKVVLVVKDACGNISTWERMITFQ